MADCYRGDGRGEDRDDAGVKRAEVITGRLVQDERGWLRLAGLGGGAVAVPRARRADPPWACLVARYRMKTFAPPIVTTSPLSAMALLPTGKPKLWINASPTCYANESYTVAACALPELNAEGAIAMAAMNAKRCLIPILPSFARSDMIARLRREHHVTPNDCV